MSSKRKEVKKGYTNKEKYIEGNKFVIKKTYTGFNHNIDYSILEKFDFVPKLYSNNEEEVVWENIPSDNVDHFDDKDLVTLGKILRTVHNSKLIFPKFNIEERVDKYLKILDERKIIVPEIKSNLVIMKYVLNKMDKSTPIHCDLLHDNIIKDDKGKLWIVDWEYAIMGDKHLELAYLIQASNLDNHQINILLKSYNNTHNNDEKCNIELIPLYRSFCDWLTILWAHAQDQMPFDLSVIKQRLNK